MASLTLEGMKQDQLVMSVARAMALANQAAINEGIDLATSLVTITEELTGDVPLWRIHYGPRDYVNQRGGDLIVLVDERAEAVRRIIRGQ